MDKTTLDKALRLSIIASVVLVSFSFFYYYVIFLPQKEQARLEEQRQILREESNHPTKGEWMQVWLENRIISWMIGVGQWQRRVVVDISIREEGKEIIVSMVSVNGEELADEYTKKGYVERIRSVVKGVIDDYPDLQNYKVFIIFDAYVENL